MKAPPLAKNYKCLTPEERFRLILAASGRGDEAERNQLVRTGDRIHLSMQDHAPYADAFNELEMLMFIELLEEAALYHDAFERCQQDELEGSEEAEGKRDSDGEADANAGEDHAATDPDYSTLDRYFDLFLASGYELRAEVEGWKLFCEKLNIPPFLLWQELPGFDRLQRALALAEKAAFTTEGFLKWLNRIRPTGEPALTEIPLTAESVAKATAQAFRQRVEWWGG
jgi:hypothetical protein